MDENTVFQSPQVSNQAIQANPPFKNPSQPQPPQPGEPSPISPPQPPLPPQSPQHPASMAKSPFSLSAIIKIAVGLIVILFFAFVVFGLIIPRFQKNSAGKAEITYWGLWEDSNIMQTAISDFKKQHPNITVNYVKQDIKQYREKLTARIQNNTGPDVFLFHNTWLPVFLSVLLPIPDDIISKQDFNTSFYPVAQKDLTKNGAIYGIPTGVDTLSLYINAQIFQAAGAEVPDNWDDFIRVARSLTVTDESGKIKTAGAAMGTFDNINHAPDIMSLLFMQNGVDIKNLASTSKSASDALTFYTTFSTGDQKVWDDTLDQSMLAFAKGNLGMYFGYSWDYFIIKALNPDLSLQIHPVPHLPQRNMTIASYWANGVSKKSKRQKEALLFTAFLAKKETQEKLFAEESKTRLFGEPYARIDLLDKLKDNTIVYPFVLQGKDAKSSFFASDTYDNALNSQMNKYLGDAVRSINSNNSTSAETAVATLSQGVSQVLRQYGQ
ncbi:MAG: hypothetical protein A3B44_02705 [Candidatus Levybacteria bacterium RIFCSPLOWO2_01_FULL_38_21]|nr:MAG: hypothetical protein A3B44_02705 [Candidatus Levybacteria bacterium RIFCSPLOWO2_01_FULL_38_21]